MGEKKITLKKVDGSKGVSMSLSDYERRKEAVMDLFMLWSNVRKEELQQHLEGHPGVIGDHPASWLQDILEDLVSRKQLKEHQGKYSA